jgi:GNAT superfamily N-acetyltransferase
VLDPPYQVRPATAADLDGVFRVRVSVAENHLSAGALAARGITPAWMARLMAEGALRVWCAEAGAEVVGFCAVKPQAREVFGLFVSPGHQGRGVGSSLLAEGMAYLAGLNRKPVRLGTAPGTRAHAFYLRRGWRPVGLDTGHGDVVLEMELAKTRQFELDRVPGSRS